MISRPFAAIALAVAALACAAAARAELVTLTNGRTLSVRTVTVSGVEAMITLRDGGRMVCATHLIARIAPDEVEHPADAVGPAPRAGHSLAEGEKAGSESPPSLAEAKAFDTIVRQAATRHNVDPKLVHAVITVESAYRPGARSSRGAMGLMQLMPGTARDLRVRDPYDAASNIDGGVRYLRQLLDRFELRLALAAYNAGAATVERFGGVPPYPETRSYVARVLQLVGAS